MMYRQGDVLIVGLDAAPSLGDRKPVEAAQAVLAAGEATGHHHILHGRARYYAETGTSLGGRLFELLEPAELRHQLEDGSQAEHNPIRLPPGWYRQIQQREYVEPTHAWPVRTRRVFD